MHSPNKTDQSLLSRGEKLDFPLRHWKHKKPNRSSKGPGLQAMPKD